MGKSLHKDQLAEVLIFGNQDAVVLKRDSEKLFVGRLRIDRQSRDDIVPFGLKKGGQGPRRDANVEEESHDALALEMRSCTCSPAKERWA